MCVCVCGVDRVSFFCIGVLSRFYQGPCGCIWVPDVFLFVGVGQGLEISSSGFASCGVTIRIYTLNPNRFREHGLLRVTWRLRRRRK